MKAVVITAPGGPEVLKLQEVEVPTVGDNEVLIKVAATALNGADISMRNGAYPPPKGSSLYPGLECSGIIEQIGKNVSNWKIGDQRNLDSLNLDGRLFVIGFMGGDKAEVDLKILLARRLTVQAAGLRNRTPENKAAIVKEVEKNVWPAIATGKVRPVVHKEFPLSEATEAHQLMESSKHIGKILLIP